jgi:lactobin A/cerein 7B family class IIb bacteriocin
MIAIESADVRELNAAGPEMPDQASQVRVLEDRELDAVNGGILPILIGVGLLAGGFTIGCILANYKMTGNFWGDIE